MIDLLKGNIWELSSKSSVRFVRITDVGKRLVHLQTYNQAGRPTKMQGNCLTHDEFRKVLKTNRAKPVKKLVKVS